LAGSTRYWYRLRATREGGFSDFSNVASAVVSASAAPSAPSALGARPLGAYVDVWWTDNSSNENGFRIERSMDHGTSWTLAATAEPSSYAWAGFLDSGRSNEIEVCYRAIAFNDAGESPPSNIACTIPPAPPSNLVGTFIDQDTLDLTWSDNSAFEDGYEVRFNNNESYCAIYDLPANSTHLVYFIDRSTDPGGYCTYCIELVATRDGGFSDGIFCQ
jgi:titin